MRIFFVFLSFVFLAACTEENTYKPTLNKYIEDTDLMINICRKFSEERDPAALRRVILAMQSARTITCTDYNGECKLFHEFESLALSLAAESTYNSGSQAKLKSKLSELISAVDEGKKKLLAGVKK